VSKYTKFYVCHFSFFASALITSLVLSYLYGSEAKIVVSGFAFSVDRFFPYLIMVMDVVVLTSMIILGMVDIGLAYAKKNLAQRVIFFLIFLLIFICFPFAVEIRGGILEAKIAFYLALYGAPMMVLVGVSYISSMNNSK